MALTDVDGNPITPALPAMPKAQEQLLMLKHAVNTLGQQLDGVIAMEFINALSNALVASTPERVADALKKTLMSAGVLNLAGAVRVGELMEEILTEYGANHMHHRRRDGGSG